MNKLDRYDLKKGVDFIGITCVFYCIDGKGNILLQKRGANCRDEQGRWDCGSGSMDFGEKSFEAVVRREIKEEYGLRPEKITLGDVMQVHRKHKGIPTHWIAFIFVAEVGDLSKAKIGEPDKIDEIGIFSLKKLPKPLHSKFLSHFDLLKKKRLI